MRLASVAIALLLAGCGSHVDASPALATAGSVAPSASPAPASTATLAPSMTPSAAPPPISAGAVREAGILYVWGADDGIYRYDGATGALTRVWGASTLAREMAYGAYVLGRHGGIELLKWDGTTADVCGGGDFADVSIRGSCAFRGAGADRAVYTDSAEGSAGAPLPRMLLPADWGAGLFAWDWNGLQLAIIRTEPRPEPVRAHNTLWVMDVRHGTLRKIFDSPNPTSFISKIQWSFESGKIAFIEEENTSASFAADGVATHLWVVDVRTGARTDLGTVLGKAAWVRWTTNERLAFVRGGGRETWDNKQIVVLEPNGTQRVVAGSLGAHPNATDRASVAPAWQPVYANAKLAWIEGPAMTIEASPDYYRGIGPSAQRVAVLDGSTQVTCPGRVTEGVRWSADGKSLLLLCRAPGVEHNALEIWFAPIGGTPRPLVSGLGDLGFGYYGMQPSLFDMTAWSLADR